MVGWKLIEKSTENNYSSEVGHIWKKESNTYILNNLAIERSTGDINFSKLEAKQIDITTSTGDVKGSLLISKIFNVNTSTGKKVLPQSAPGGYCNITTSTGDIIISIEK